MRKTFTASMAILLFLLITSFDSTKNSLSDTQKTFIKGVDTTSAMPVYIFEINDMIAKPAWRTTQKAFEEAENMGAKLIIIKLNTYGGAVDMADSIRTKILRSKIPVYVFIDNNAASAGALISIACDSIYMSSAANIGAATVVDQEGKVVADKYQSYMRSKMRSTAEANGRDPDIAQAMVDPSIYIEGIIDSGKVLTFTTSEAIQHGFCEAQVNSIDEILRRNKVENYQITEQKLTGLDKFINFLVSPIISGLLIMMIIGGIYFELQSPGIGFALGLSVFAALLYFAPLYLEGLAANWEILIFVAGLILIGIEVFVLPGFGVPGILGVLLVIVGLTLSLVENIGFDFRFVNGGEFIYAFFVVVIAIFLSIIGSYYLSKKLFGSQQFKLALYDVQNKEMGYTSAVREYNEMIGKVGKAKTILRPSGKIVIDDHEYDATALTGYIEKGEDVEVIKYATSSLVVKMIHSQKKS